MRTFTYETVVTDDQIDMLGHLNNAAYLAIFEAALGPEHPIVADALGNVGYLDLRYFAAPWVAQPTATAAMAVLANADALIFDLRHNQGGMPGMVQFLCPYLFVERTHLNSLYFREGDRTDEFWTHDVPGRRMPDVPVFVLTSAATFSAAEEFCYDLRTRERATLVGEQTRGGANPGRRTMVASSSNDSATGGAAGVAGGGARYIVASSEISSSSDICRATGAAGAGAAIRAGGGVGAAGAGACCGTNVATSDRSKSRSGGALGEDALLGRVDSDCLRNWAMRCATRSIGSMALAGGGGGATGGGDGT